MYSNFTSYTLKHQKIVSKWTYFYIRVPAKKNTKEDVKRYLDAQQENEDGNEGIFNDNDEDDFGENGLYEDDINELTLERSDDAEDEDAHQVQDANSKVNLKGQVLSKRSENAFKYNSS